MRFRNDALFVGKKPKAVEELSNFLNQMSNKKTRIKQWRQLYVWRHKVVF